MREHSYTVETALVLNLVTETASQIAQFYANNLHSEVEMCFFAPESKNPSFPEALSGRGRGASPQQPCSASFWASRAVARATAAGPGQVRKPKRMSASNCSRLLDALRQPPARPALTPIESATPGRPPGGQSGLRPGSAWVQLGAPRWAAAPGDSMEPGRSRSCPPPGGHCTPARP